MHTCIKTGAVLKIRDRDWYSEIDRNLDHTIYGDIHLVGTSAILYFPPKQVGGWAVLHGHIELPNTYWLRDHPQADSVLVVPVTAITFKEDALHSSDRELWQTAIHQYNKGHL